MAASRCGASGSKSSGAIIRASYKAVSYYETRAFISSLSHQFNSGVKCPKESRERKDVGGCPGDPGRHFTKRTPPDRVRGGVRVAGVCNNVCTFRISYLEACTSHSGKPRRHTRAG